MDEVDARFKTPFTAILAGQPGAGKSQFVYHFLKYQHILLDKPFEAVYWIYGQDNDFTQSLPERLPHIKITLIRGVPDNFEEYLDPSINKLIVFDDVMRAISNNPLVTDLFSIHCRHTKSSVFVLLQNILYKGSERATFLRCAHLLVLFKNPLDLSSIYTLAKRIYPRKPQVFLDIFHAATLTPYSPLVIDGGVTTDERLRFRSHLFDENIQHVYIPHDLLKNNKKQHDKNKER